MKGWSKFEDSAESKRQLHPEIDSTCIPQINLSIDCTDVCMPQYFSFLHGLKQAV